MINKTNVVQDEQERRAEEFRKWLDAPIDINDFYTEPKPEPRPLAWKVGQFLGRLAVLVAVCTIVAAFWIAIGSAVGALWRSW